MLSEVEAPFSEDENQSFGHHIAENYCAEVKMRANGKKQFEVVPVKRVSQRIEQLNRNHRKKRPEGNRKRIEEKKEPCRFFERKAE